MGPGQPCFIIAEAGVNHNGDLDMAKRLVDLAAEAGADAVKFQTFTAEEVVAQNAPKADYQVRTTGADENQFDILKSLELPFGAFGQLKDYCHERNILFLSSPFGLDSIDLLAGLGVAAFKVPSGEITNLPYLTHAASHGKPLIVSTGMAYLSEVETAVRTIEAANNTQFVVLQCVSNYPADPADVNLRAMQAMATAFNVPVGYSDHTLGIQVPLAAVALGACVIEKHFTMDRNLPGPDHPASLEPAELAELVTGIRIVEAALGNGRKEPVPSEANTAAVARKSLVAARHIPAGATLTEELIAIKRPGTGLPPAMRQDILGRTVRVDIPADSLFTLDMLS